MYHGGIKPSQGTAVWTQIEVGRLIQIDNTDTDTGVVIVAQ